MLQTLKNAWRVDEIRRKLIFTGIILLLYRLGCAIPVPFVDSKTIAEWFSGNADNLLGYFSVINGEAFSQATLFALSISPYITASIVMQLLAVAIPALERMSKEGPEGQKKITQITRYVTVALALVTAYGYYRALDSRGALTSDGWFAGLVIVTSYCAGASLIMWLGEKINDNGIGNGISMILFVNIVSSLPSMFGSAINLVKEGGKQYIASVVAIAVIMVAIVFFVVWITNSERRIPVQYAKRQMGRKVYGGTSTNLPIKLNMSGVMPIIFAQSIVTLPSTLALIFGWKTDSGFFQYFSMTSYIGVAVNFALIIAFSYFYITISFNPVEVANNLKKNGGTITGIRPGKPTTDYIVKVLNRITFIGALFLGFIAVFPQVIYWLFPNSGMASMVFGGSSLLIVVGVILETFRELEGQITMRNYKGFLS
ncbi:MAG: preprotein translocase subunit SecY [Ruminococcaceae bacterium]|nr:preprotein translocase subunit SecY [Oscillospiraceae bacterium]